MLQILTACHPLSVPFQCGVSGLNLRALGSALTQTNPITLPIVRIACIQIKEMEFEKHHLGSLQADLFQENSLKETMLPCTLYQLAHLRGTDVNMFTSLHSWKHRV